MQYRIVLFILLFWSCHQSSGPKQQLRPTTLVEDIIWLKGTWQVDNKGLYEEWVQMEKWLLGRSYKIENGDTIVLESMQITYREGELYYIPTVADQNNGQPILFHLINGSPKQVVFENEAHDFPQRIGYRKKGKSHVQAWIEGVDEKGVEKKVEFEMRK